MAFLPTRPFASLGRQHPGLKPWHILKIGEALDFLGGFATDVASGSLHDSDNLRFVCELRARVEV